MRFIIVSLVAVSLLLSACAARPPALMTSGEYDRLNLPHPYVLRAQARSGSLLYFGARHFFDPSDPQAAQIEQAWVEFRPSLALIESNPDIAATERDAVIRQAGDPGLTKWLAARDGVPVRSLDPDRAEEIAHLRSRGWTAEQLVVFYTLRQVAQNAQRPSPGDLDVAVPRYLANLASRPGLEGGPVAVAEFGRSVARLLPELSDWRTVPSIYFDPDPPPPLRFTNRIQAESNRFRGLHHIRVLAREVRAGQRVFAVMGASHVIVEARALRHALDTGRAP